MSKRDFSVGDANGGAGMSPYDAMALIQDQVDEIYAGLGDGTDLSQRLSDLKDLASNGFFYLNGATVGVRELTDGAEITWTNGDGAGGAPVASLAVTGVTAGTYVFPDVTVDSKGRITAIAEGVGITGPAGPTGATGPAGADGADGADGLGAGDMLAANNLSDLVSAATARTNLGLGALAVGADAGDVPFTPVGTVAATDVQAAIAEVSGDVTALDTAKLDKAGGTISGSLTVSGDFTVSGTTTTVDTVTLEVTDNLIAINVGEVGAGVTAGTAGIEVDRGSATNYQFLFDESDDAFKVGQVGGLQKVATRDDTPASGGLGVFSTSSYSFVTVGSPTWLSGALSVPGTAVATGGMPIVTDATTTRTLVIGDNGGYLRFTSGSATTVTVPPNSSVAFPTGAEVVLMAAGAGVVTIAEGSGVTVNSLGGLLDLSGQFAAATLKKVGTDEWDLVGGLA